MFLRNVEADVALRSTAAVFTYCRSRGLFAGISLEGSYLIERKETNRKYAQQPPNCLLFSYPIILYPPLPPHFLLYLCLSFYMLLYHSLLLPFIFIFFISFLTHVFHSIYLLYPLTPPFLLCFLLSFTTSFFTLSSCILF